MHFLPFINFKFYSFTHTWSETKSAMDVRTRDYVRVREFNKK